MGNDRLSYTAFKEVAREATKGGTKTVTAKAEQKFKASNKLEELVDPAGNKVIRQSLTRMDPKGDKLVATVGLAMAVETLFDTTGSMGGNVDLAFEALPNLYNLLALGPQAVLRRYDTHIANAIFGDQSDRVILCRSHFEMGKKIPEQLTMMVPEKEGNDTPEDPMYGLFGAAYLTRSVARHFGLRSYHFMITDAPGRRTITKSNLTRVFGGEVFEKVRENGFQIKENNLPDTAQIVNDLLEEAHAFAIIINPVGGALEFWKEFYGESHLIQLTKMKLLPFVQAAIIGLTEGTLTLQSVEKFLTEVGKLNAADARAVTRAVAGIPIGAQMKQKNFNKVFRAGALFNERGETFPIGFDDPNYNPDAHPVIETGETEMWH